MSGSNRTHSKRGTGSYRRCLPSAIKSYRMDKEAESGTIFGSEVRMLAESLAAGFSRNAGSTEAHVYTRPRDPGSSTNGAVVADCRLNDEEAVSIVSKALSNRGGFSVKQRGVVKTAYMDTVALTSAHNGIHCSSVKCQEVIFQTNMVTMFLSENHMKQTCFPCRSDVHHYEESERLTINFSKHVKLELDAIEGGLWRAKVSARRESVQPHERSALMRALTCIVR